jgi:hypothetical protein
VVVGRIRADKAHEKLLALGYAGSERSTRRAIAQVKAAWRLGHTRIHRPWITEPGMWLQYDFGDGPRIGGVKTILFVAWLAFSRFRIVIPSRTGPRRACSRPWTSASGSSAEHRPTC